VRARLLLALVLGSSLGAPGCATETEVLFGEPDEILGADAATISSGGSCTPDLSCSVSFRDDIFPVLVETARCSSAGCHATAIAQFEFPENAGDAREALLAYVFQGSEAYVLPCQPEASKFLCNLNLGEAAQPGSSCGSPMPKLIDDAVSDTALSQADYDAIEQWITCGAPDN
jgi:hypothetical protein